MLNVKMCNGSHAAFDKLMLGKFCRSQPTLKRFHLETDSNISDRLSENFGENDK